MRDRQVQQCGQQPDAVGGHTPRWRRWLHGSTCLVAVTLVAATGCRSGARALSAPKWPSFPGSKAKQAEAPALASVPTNDAPIKKPSASATPYPTTSTPAGYVVNDPATATGGGADAIQTAATDPAAVTYGVTPPMPAAPALEPVQQTNSLAEASPPAPISPQVGPYATLPPPPPAAESPASPGIPAGSYAGEQPPLAAVPAGAGPPGGGYPVTTPSAYGASPPASTAFPTTAGYEPSPRVADARGLEPAAAGYAAAAIPAAAAPVASEAAPPLTPVADPGAGVSARYASQGSRYGGPEAGASLAPTASPDLGSGLQGTAPAAFPAAGSAPAVAPPPGPLPAANPDGLTSPPVRRPDPVFRPGGTSSYRPAEQIFVDETPVAPAAVRTASYEVSEPLPPPAVGYQ